MMTHRNTSHQDPGLSPAEMLSPCYSKPEVTPEMLDTSDNPTRVEQPREWFTTADTDQHLPDTPGTVPDEMEVG